MGKAAGGLLIVVLSLAQFIIVVDTSVMNVAIPTLVDEFNVTITAMQGAITLYALVMAAFMLTGGKLGEVYGRKKIFLVGAAIYLVGTTLTAVSWNFNVLLIGWSILEGFGAALMMPAMMALITVNFAGAAKAKAFAVVGGIGGAAAGLGPVIGGFLVTYASWRWAFVAEAIIAIAILLMHKHITDKPVEAGKKIDFPSVALSAVGMLVIVISILQVGTYGLIRAKEPMMIGDIEFAPFGLSPVFIGVLLGAGILAYFMKRQKRLKAKGDETLLDPDIVKQPKIRRGQVFLVAISFVIAGYLFIMPLFLQVVLGYSAFESGFAMLPMPVGLFLASLVAAKLSEKYSIRKLAVLGASIMLVGLVWLGLSITIDSSVWDVVIPLFIVGAGYGTIFSNNINYILGLVKEKFTGQLSGLNYTSTQLGFSLGTAIVGSVLLVSLAASASTLISDTYNLNVEQEAELSTTLDGNVEFQTNDQLVATAEEAGLSGDDIDNLVEVNNQARIDALNASVVTMAVIAALAIILGSTYPNQKLVNN